MPIEKRQDEVTEPFIVSQQAPPPGGAKFGGFDPDGLSIIPIGPIASEVSAPNVQLTGNTKHTPPPAA